jgi:hypothetical protein
MGEGFYITAGGADLPKQHIKQEREEREGTQRETPTIILRKKISRSMDGFQDSGGYSVGP